MRYLPSFLVLLSLFLFFLPSSVLCRRSAFPLNSPTDPVVFPLAPQVWPQPVNFTWGPNNPNPVYLSSQFQLVCNVSPSNPCPSFLNSAVERYFTELIPWAGPIAQQMPNGAIPFTRLVITAGADEPLALGVDESYSLSASLDVSGSFASGQLSCATTLGCFRALESLSQLFQWDSTLSLQDPTQNYYLLPNLPVLIEDSPRFPYRGVLLDTSRHFLQPSEIEKLLHAFSWLKFNVLHWHVVDDQSWPLQSQKFPQFSASGSWSPSAVYTPADTAAILKTANELGIMVVFEFDVPAHATAWGAGYPSLIVDCPAGTRKHRHPSSPSDGDYCEPLMDPTGVASPYISGLLSEFPAQSGSGFVHFGGDELETYYAWNHSASVQAWANAQGFTTNQQIRQYFQSQIAGLARQHGLTAIYWEEVFDSGIKLHTNETIFASWTGSSTTFQITQAGFRAIHSYGFYLDQQLPPGSTHYLWLDTWQNFYTNDPINANFSAAQAALVMGGEASMWAEQVDSFSVETRMFPRIAATSEALWTAVHRKDVDAAESRLNHFACFLSRRGIRSSPIRPSHCELSPNAVLNQQQKIQLFNLRTDRSQRLIEEL